MTLKTQMAADVPAVFLNASEHAEAATYTPSGGSGRAITVVLEEHELIGTTGQPDGRGIPRRATIWASSDPTTGIATPLEGETIVAAGVTWRIAGGFDDRCGMWMLEAESFQRTEVSGPGFRIDRH